MHEITINEKEFMNVKASDEEHMEGFRWGKGEIIISKMNKCKNVFKLS